MLEILNLPDQPGIVCIELRTAIPLALNERLTDEEFACELRIVRRKAHPTLLVDRETVERAALECNNLPSALLPMGLGPIPAKQIACSRLDPFGLDVCHAAREHAGRFDDFGSQNPATRLLGARRSRPDPELDAASAKVGRHTKVAFDGLRADVAQKTRQQGAVHLLEGGGRRVPAPAELVGELHELTANIAPFAQAPHRKVAPVKLGLKLAVAFLLGIGLFIPVPELDVGKEVRLFVRKLPVRLIRRLLCIGGTLSRILNGEPCADRQQLFKAALFGACKQHAAETRVDGKPSELPAHAREFAFLRDGIELLQNGKTVRNRAGRRRLNERKFAHVAQLERNGAQDDGGKVRAQNFGIRKGGAACKVILAVQSDADAVGHAAASAGALIGGGLTHGFDLKLLDLVAIGVALDAGKPRVHDEPDARHRDGGFRHIGGEHDSPRSGGAKHALLLCSRQARKKRKNLRCRGTRLAKNVRGLADFALARQEHQNVPASRSLEFAHRIVNRADEGLVVGLIHVLDRTIANLDGIGAARDRQNRSGTPVDLKMSGKSLGVDRGRSDDHLEVAPLRKQALQIAEQEVDVDRSLVRFVDDHRVIGAKHRIILSLGKQNAVRHQLDGGARRHRVGEAHLVAHDFAGLGLELLGDALGDRARRDAAGLSVRDHPVNAAPRHHGDFRQLRRLARAGFAADDHNPVLADGLRNLLATLCLH